MNHITFEEALKLFKQGKKIRRIGWPKDSYIHIVDGQLYDVNRIIYNITLIPCDWTEQLSWEEYKPEITFENIKVGEKFIDPKGGQHIKTPEYTAWDVKYNALSQSHLPRYYDRGYLVTQ